MTLRLFLVEDSPILRRSLAVALEELAPVKVIGVAEDEPTAVSWLVTNPDGCDLLVTDLFLQRGSGLGVLRAAMNAEKMFAVVLTNYATSDVRNRCLDLGASRVFDKSSEFEALLDYCALVDRGAVHG